VSPRGFFDEKFDLPILKSKVVVEQLYICPGFYMYLSHKGGFCPILRVPYSFDDGLHTYLYTRPLASEQVSVSLRSGTSASACTNETLASTGWSVDGATGICQQAYQEGAVYTPLFRLRSLGRRHWLR
jgi:hypothetical protein